MELPGILELPVILAIDREYLRGLAGFEVKL
jgi:hypothetical protein